MRSEDSDLLAEMFRSLRADPPWARFLQRLSSRVGGQFAAVVVADGAAPWLRYQQPMASGWLADDLLLRMRYRRVYGPEDAPDMPPFRALRVRSDGGGDAWLIVGRQSADFAATTSALLTLIAESFAVAAHSFAQMQRDDLVHRQMHATLARLGLAWVLVEGQTGTITALASSGALADRVLVQGRLRLPAPMQRHLVGAFSGGFSGTLVEVFAMQEGDLQLLALPGAQGRALIYLQQVGQLPQPSAQVLANFTGLTPSEARFLQKLVQGLTIGQAGAALSLSPQTARYYSKQIYAKLGVAHQTALMRQLDGSVLRLA